MNLKTAALRLGVHYQTAYRWVRSGQLVAVKVGAGYEISLLKDIGLGSPPYVTARAFAPGGAAGGDNLRFEIRWDYANNGTALADGDTYTVTAKIGDDPLLFDKSYVAKYEEETECGSVCKVFTVKP